MRTLYLRMYTVVEAADKKITLFNNSSSNHEAMAAKEAQLANQSLSKELEGSNWDHEASNMELNFGGTFKKT